MHWANDRVYSINSNTTIYQSSSNVSVMVISNLAHMKIQLHESSCRTSIATLRVTTYQGVIHVIIFFIYTAP